MRTVRTGRAGLVALIVAPVMLLGVVMAPADAATVYRRDVYFRSGYERQVDSRTCVPASVAMMLNFIAGRDLGLSQMGILRYAQPRDALNDSVQRGTDPLGWAKALTYFSTRAGKGAFTYNWEAYGSEGWALKRAARQIAFTNRPVGLLVKNGTHAMVMTGFEATADPRRGDFRVLYVWVSDPLGNRHQRYAAADSPLNRYLELDATAYYDSKWYRNYVIVAPAG